MTRHNWLLEGLLYEDALKGMSIDIKASPDIRDRLAREFGMSALHSLNLKFVTIPQTHRGVAARLKLHLDLAADLSQECGVSLEVFRHEVVSELDVELVRASECDDVHTSGEHELRAEDLNEPDRVENGRIDLEAYVIEALGLAYDPYARASGVQFEEPERAVEPSPFDILSRLKSG